MTPSRSCVLCAAALLLCTLTTVSAQAWTPATAGRVGYGETPVWSDEFDGTGLDTTKWTPEEVAWPDNGELQYYSGNTKYVNTASGMLGITAAKDANGGRAYTSGRISTKKAVTFKHGLFAARIKMTKGQGIWPAFWMFGTGKKYSEIDIAESVGGTSATTTPPTGSGDDASAGTLCHFATEDGGPVTKGPGCTHHAPAGKVFADDYHVFWMEWTGTEMWAGVDANDQQKFVDDISKLPAFQASMYLILNVAVGGSFPGSPDATTVFPQTMSVDWVKVYAKNGESIMTSVAAPATPTSGACSATETTGTCATAGETCQSGVCTATPTTGGGTPTPAPVQPTGPPAAGTTTCQSNNPTGSCGTGLTCSDSGFCQLKSGEACSATIPNGSCTDPNETCHGGRCVTKTQAPLVLTTTGKSAAATYSPSNMLAVTMAMLCVLAAAIVA